MILKINETCKFAILSANSQTINRPLVNILDSRLSRVYRTDFTTVSEIVFDNIIPVDVSAVAIANHNISSSAEFIKIQGNSSNSWGSPAFEKDLTWNEGVITDNFSDQTYRYWRIQISDLTNPDGFIEIGRGWVGEGYDPLGIKYLVVHDRLSASKKSRSIGGQSYLDRRYFYSVVSIKIPKIKRAEYNKIVVLFELVDIGVPFFVTFDRAGEILGTLYVTYNFRGLKLTPLGKRDLYTTGMKLIEEV